MEYADYINKEKKVMGKNYKANLGNDFLFGNLTCNYCY